MPYDSPKKQREHDQRYYQEHNDEILEKHRQYYQQHKVERLEYAQQRQIKRMYGSEERYNQGMLKYEGECAFACGKEAKLVHHIDGKNILNSLKEEVNNDLSNLLPLCRGCHNWVHNKKIGGKQWECNKKH